METGLFALSALLVGFLAAQQVRHERIMARTGEAFAKERAALLDRIAGTSLSFPDEPEVRQGRAYGTDEDEWVIEQERLKGLRGEG